MDPQLWWLVLLPVLAAGGFLSAPKTPILGIIGDKVVLPCQVGSMPVPADFSIRWTFHVGQSQRIPVGSYDGKGWREEPDERYWGRTEFFHGEFRAGNMSLLLRGVRSSDQGSYGCQVSFQDISQEVLVELEVAAVGEAPSVILRGPEKRALGLSCRASGWFPRPELLWLDRRGHVRREPAATTATVTPGGLFSVEGSLRLQPGSDLEISCQILNRRLNASRASRVRIHDSFLPSISRWLQIFLAVLFLNLALVSVVFCLLQKSHKRTLRAEKAKLEMEEEKKKVKALLDGEKAKKREAKIQFKKRLGQLKAELDFWEARSHAAPVALDPEARLLDLGDPLPRAALVARDALGAGKGYWEVELGQQRSWALGVLREPPDPRDPRDPRDPPWLWALCASQGRLFSASRALGEHPRDLPVLGNNPRDLSVLGEHPRDLSALGNNPQDLPVLGEHPRDLPVLGNDPRDLPVLGEHPRDLSALGNDPRDLPVLGEHPRDLPVLGNDPRDLPVLGEHPRDLSALGNDPRDLPVLGEHPRDLSALGNDPRDLPVLGELPRDLSALGELPRDLSVLGVLLDREEARLEFYDAERRALLAGIALRDPRRDRDPRAGIGPGRLLPFVSRGERRAPRLRPVPVPLPVPLPGPLGAPGIGKGAQGSSSINQE